MDPALLSNCGVLEGATALSPDGFPEGVAPSPPLPPRPARLALPRVRPLPSFAVLFWPPPVLPPHLSSGPSSKHPDLTTSIPIPKPEGSNQRRPPERIAPSPDGRNFPISLLPRPSCRSWGQEAASRQNFQGAPRARAGFVPVGGPLEGSVRAEAGWGSHPPPQSSD